MVNFGEPAIHHDGLNAKDEVIQNCSWWLVDKALPRLF